jgi:hypothetical protein
MSNKELIIKYRDTVIVHLIRQDDNSISYIANKNMTPSVERWLLCGYNGWQGNEADAIPRKTLAKDSLFFQHIKEGVEKKFPEYIIIIK